VAVRAQGAQARPGRGVFLIGYGAFRFIAEYFREPDDFLGILSLGMSMGQWLCIPMIVAGVLMGVVRQAPGLRGSANHGLAQILENADFGLRFSWAVAERNYT
jgi:prolipoprotein diacylglyceryltransferase